MEDALLGITNIKDAAKKILMLAAEIIARPDHSIHLHACIPELKENEIGDVVDLSGRKGPDIVSTLERSMDLHIQEAWVLWNSIRPVCNKILRNGE